VATFASQREAIRALAKAGADLNLLENDRYDGVTIASVADDEETLRTLLSLGASAKQITSRYDGTALIAAAHLGHDGVVRQLIAAGAPLDHVNNLHWTAVIESIVLGNGGARHQATLQGADRRPGQSAAGRPPGRHAAATGPFARLRHGPDAEGNCWPRDARR
jgi:ankyrin repeat protein